MRVDSSCSLKEIASASEAAERVLEAHGLDFCCHGEASLRAACAELGVDLGAVEDRLRACPECAKAAWDDVTRLIDEIVGTCHRRTRRALAKTRNAVGQTTFGALIDAVAALEKLLLAQMDDEEALFAHVQALANARAERGPFPAPPFTLVHTHRKRLRDGHVNIHRALQHVRELARSPETDSPALRHRIDELGHAIVRQMHLENNELLPRALALEPE